MDQASKSERTIPSQHETRTFGLLLREYRLEAGLTQDALAERAGLSVRGIADLERGARRFPYTDTVQRLAGALGLDPAERAALSASGRRSEERRPAGPALRPLAAQPVPAPPTRLIGREPELEDLCRRVLDPDVRLLTLTGPGGTGKTRLALALMERMQGAFEHGCFFVDLAPLSDPLLVVPTIACTLGLTEVPGQSLLEHLADVLGARQVMLLLDNCEHVASAAPDVAYLLARCPALRVVATSRETLHLHWERLYPVAPLEVPQRRDARSRPIGARSSRRLVPRSGPSGPAAVRPASAQCRNRGSAVCPPGRSAASD